MMKFKILPELPTKRQVPSSSRDSSTGTEEDEVHMANCLILLARGDTPTDVYDCKTCNRTFPSFQALGGHRASHKRPRLKSPAAADEGVRRLGNKLSSKIHECSVCGSVFASGQALGGHMRRHRAITTAAGKNDAASRVVICGKPRSALALDLDLNMPAPAEVDEKCNQQPRMVFSAAALLVIGG